MASNNRKAPPRWPPKNTDDRNRHGTSRPPQLGGSLHAKRRIDNKKIQETLDEMFYNVFDTEIIRSVAHSCGWKLNKSIETLMMLSEDSESPNSKLVNSFGSSSSYNSQFVSKEKASVSKSRYGKDSSKTDKNMAKEMYNESVFTCTSDGFKQPSKGKSVMMNASQGPIKVMYKGQDDSDISDDDADVVIEEENEYVMSELDFQFTNESARSMYQFLTPFVPPEQSLNDHMQYSRVCASKENVLSLASNKSMKPTQSPPNLSHKFCDKSPGKKTKHWPKLERIKRQINDGIKIMVLMRGCPGSGKTSLARKIIKSTYGQNEQNYIFSTDHYFIYVGNGKYKFDPTLLPSAHKWNQDRVGEEVKKETNPIIIDNTNLEAWEMEPYVTVAVKFGYDIEFLEPRTSWRNNSFELEQKNTHGVSRRKIEDMLARFQHDLTPARVLALYNLKYTSNNLPPQYISQRKLVLNQEDDSLKHGTKKKLKTKNEDNSFKNSLHLCENEGAKQLQVSETLSSDFTDKEIKDSIGKLLSEFNRSIEAASTEEMNLSFGNIYHEDCVARASHEVTNENDFVGNCSENLSRVEQGKEISEQGVDDLLELGTKITDDETDFVCDSFDNFEDANFPDDSEGEYEGNVAIQYRGAALSAFDATDDLKDIEMKNVTGMEYVLVLSDGTLLPQRSYQKEENISCPSKNTARKWEYLLMTDDNSKLLFHPVENKNDSSQNTDINKSTEVISESPDGNTCNLISSDDEGMKDVTNENAFLQKISAEEPPLEYLLFPNEDMKDVLYSSDVIENVGDEDVKSNEASKNSYKCLDLLLAEGAASLNIAFAGVDDTLPLRGSPVVQKTVNENKHVENEYSVDTVKTIDNFLQVDSEEPRIVPIGGNILSDILQTQNKVNCENNELISFMDVHSSDSKVKEGKDEMPTGVCISESDTQIASFLNSEEETVNIDAPENTRTDLLSLRSLCEAKLNASKESVLESFVVHSHSSKDSKKKTNEKDILEEWAEGTSWDEQETAAAAHVNLHPDNCSPKPARNNRRQVSMECSPLKSIEKEKVDICEIVSTESWSAVEEPLSTWDIENELLDKNKEQLSQEIEPQPQREMFALILEEVKSAKEEIMAIKDLGKSSDDDDDQSKEQSSDDQSKEHFVEAEPSLKSTAESEDLISLTENAVFRNPVIATDSETKDEKEGKLSPCIDLCSSEKDSMGASSSISASITSEIQKDVIHSSTNTHHSDFILLGNVNMGSEVEVTGVKILPTFARNIVDNSMAGNKQEVRKIGQILMLDKSSMTYDIVSSILDTENVKEQLRELVSMFPHCRIEDLQEIFEKCNRDINWTVDLLLESASQGIGISTPNSTQGVELETTLLDVSLLPTVNEIVENAHSSDTLNASTTAETLSSSPVQLLPETSLKSPVPSKRNGKKDRTPISEMSLLLKKQLEETIVINEEHYSEHVSRIRKLRHGEVMDLTEIPGSVQDDGQVLDENINPQSLSGVSSNELLQQTNYFELSSSNVVQPGETEWELHEIESKDVVEEEEETIALNMDLSFAEQLHSLFGTASLPFNQGMKPTLNLPLSLARQLHYYMMEAEQNTYDLMTQEDEELARKLQVQEDQASAEAIASSAKQVPDLREIMDMEMALALYKTDQKQNSPESKEDLATKLTKNLLCEWFPSLPKDVLVNVFEAHNHSFEETLEVLLASTEQDNSVRTVMSPEARAAHEKALLEKANLEGEKNKENMRPYSMEADEVSQEQALQDATYFRSEASRHYDLRNECQRKAQSAYQRGFTAAASYYSQMASLHKERIEDNNARAASSLLLAHSLGNLSTTLDLHFLYVVEALQVLDMFLDHHINQLLKSSHRSVPVFVITGRGARSCGGRSRIKPAVVQRLDQRGLRHEEVNPGLLKIVITRNATSSNRISG